MPLAHSSLSPFLPATKRISLEFPNGRICIRSRRSRDVSDCRRQCGGGGGRVVFGRLPHLSWSLPDSLSLPLPLSVSKQDFREFRPSPSLTLSHFLPPLLSSLLFSHFPFAFRAPPRERERAFLLLNCFSLSLARPPLSLSLAHFALNVPNSRENGRAIETAQQKKVIIKLAPKMTLTGVGRQDGRTPSRTPSLFGPFLTSS